MEAYFYLQKIIILDIVGFKINSEDPDGKDDF